ncbi:MAG: hypothetical protein K1X67_05630, partial [Fimbriimonadaceae bacterium]|nr:hypothetical protein [Fimbriimonadaceae bacterium]
MTFEEALNRIASLQTKGWRLGLDRMEEFLRRAGLDDALGHAAKPDPHNARPTSHGWMPVRDGDPRPHPQPLSTGVERGVRPRFIHVAGTNGKGSVTAFLQSLLVAQGYRTGATFSPYVYDVRERIQIDGELISREQFAAIAERLWPIAVEMEGTPFEGPTEFEFKTAMGFAAWKEAGCEWVALETGLGGRLDATNVVTPACSAIVSIGYDHQAILGNTLREISVEKAGIIKLGCPVVIGVMDDEPLKAILDISAERGSPAWVLGRDVQFGADWVEGPGFRYDGLHPGIRGAVQPHNLAVAIAALHAAGAVRDPSQISEGAGRTRLPGRMEERWVDGKLWILDGAHNAESAQSVVDSLYRWQPAGSLPYRWRLAGTNLHQR